MMDNNKRHENDDKSNRDMTDAVDELIERILEMFEESISDDLENPVMQGFTVISQPGKNPSIFGFAKESLDNTPSEEEKEEEDLYVIQNEPFIEVQQTGDSIYVIADLSVEEDCVEFHPSSTHVDITVITNSVCYSKYVELPCDVDPATIVSTYNNGVLELILKYPVDTE